MEIKTKGATQSTHSIAPPPVTTSYQDEHNALGIAHGEHDGHGHDEHDHGPLMHHFDDMVQQRESITIGMWTFLMTEIMMFSGLFFCYAFFRWKFHDAFMLGSQQLDIDLGTGNTFVLLASSMTMAMAVHSAQVGNRKKLVAYMIGTLIFGGAFLGIKGIEWSADYREGMVPEFHLPYSSTTHGNWDESGHTWRTSHHAHEAGLVAGPTPEGFVWDYKHKKAVSVDQVKMYFMIYFCMTGLHAIHMVAGALILLVMIVMAMNGQFGNGNDQPVEIFGLYWHFVDIVWVFLFPLLYLVAGFHPGGH